MQILHFNIYNLTVFIHILYDYIIPKTLVSFLYLHCHSFLFFLIISSLILLCLLHEIPPLPWIANIKLCYIYSLSFPGSFFFFLPWMTSRKTQIIIRKKMQMFYVTAGGGSIGIWIWYLWIRHDFFPRIFYFLLWLFYFFSPHMVAFFVVDFI